MDQGPSPMQRAALEQAAGRTAGSPWRGPRSGAERCCELGWLEPAHLAGYDPSKIDSVVYELTAKGREALAFERQSTL